MTDLNFDLLSWNVRGLGDNQKRRKLFNWVKKHTSNNNKLDDLILNLIQSCLCKKQSCLWFVQSCLCKKHIRLTKHENNGNNSGED